MDPKERNEKVIDRILYLAMYRWYLGGAPAAELKERMNIIEICGRQFLELRRKFGDEGMRALLDHLDRVEEDLAMLAEPNEPAPPLPLAVDEAVYEQRITALATRINELEWTVRTENCLGNTGKKYVFELVEMIDRELLKTRNFGRKSLGEVKVALGGLGLTLAMKLDEATIAAVKAKIAEQESGK